MEAQTADRYASSEGVSFNAIDKHNSKRQGATSFEDTWKTQVVDS